MARFQYNGEQARPGLVAAYGPCSEILVRKHDGVAVYNPVAPATSFPVGQDIGYTITDTTSIRTLNADPRFTQIA